MSQHTTRAVLSGGESDVTATGPVPDVTSTLHVVPALAVRVASTTGQLACQHPHRQQHAMSSTARMHRKQYAHLVSST